MHHSMDQDALLRASAEDQARVIQEMAEVEGPAALVDWLQAAQSDETRRKLFAQAFQHLDQRSWANADLDAQVAVARGAIAEYLRQAEQHSVDDDELSRKLRDSANALSYNLAASLADCWPDDDLPREARHYTEGFAAAENCVRWREELGKGPRSLSMAHWARGIHLLGLRDFTGALEAWQTSQGYANQAAREAGKPEGAVADGDFNAILGQGFVGIGRMLSGDAAGQADFDSALDVFNAQLAGEEEPRREDAQIGLGQLRKTFQNYVLGISAGAGA
jgi:hypothetical protein